MNKQLTKSNSNKCKMQSTAGMSAESPRHGRAGGPLTVPAQPPTDRTIIDTVSGFINDVALASASSMDPKDVILWARFETADINEPTPEGDNESDISPLLLILGYGSGVQVWLVPPAGDAQEVLSWRQGSVRVLRVLPTPQFGDCFASKRPLIALCDSASPGPAFCSLSFISIKGGEQVKSIKFKNQILDVLANKRSVVVSFSERFAVFDAGTLEDRMTVTTCYPCPCPLGSSFPINPLALGDRWLAYADKKLNPSKRSNGGCEGEGVASYTATVLHAAKSLGRGLRGLGESVAHSLAGSARGSSLSPSPPTADAPHAGVVTILDIEGNEEEDNQGLEEPYDPMVAHFVAHSDVIIAMKFDGSGSLLITADRRGHDFHVFRINPHPCTPSMASVHHLYILHRGDTTAKVQDIAISGDSRWAAVSTLRGTTHVFAISAYGGACGVRTHTQPRVVNRLSRFHRSAGLPVPTPVHQRCHSPVAEGLAGAWFPNPRLPPYPTPTLSAPLAQLRPTANLPTHTITRTSNGRQRLSSLSEDGGGAPLPVAARFGWPTGGRGPALVPLYLTTAGGLLLHLALRPRVAKSVPKEKICDDSPIEIDVEPVAQWPLRRPATAADLLAPVPASNPLLQPMSCRRFADMSLSEEERWVSQVEIVTHAGPHRRLWMGPQFVFKTYNCHGSNTSLSEVEAVEVSLSARAAVARSTPVNVPAARAPVPLFIDSGSASSLEHSPSESVRRRSDGASRAASMSDVRLREDLAEAMREEHGWPCEARSEKKMAAGVARAVDQLGTVVVPSPTEPPVVDEMDCYISCNDDETTFRPVVRAPAVLPLHSPIIVRPLPHDTTIPVDRVSPSADMSPVNDPMPLTTDVVIPAALTTCQLESCQDLCVDMTEKNIDNSDRNEFKHFLDDKEEKSAPVKNDAPNEDPVKQDDKCVVKDNNCNINIILDKDLISHEIEVCKRDNFQEVSLARYGDEINETPKSLPINKLESQNIQTTSKDITNKDPTYNYINDIAVNVCSDSYLNNEFKELDEDKQYVNNKSTNQLETFNKEEFKCAKNYININSNIKKENESFEFVAKSSKSKNFKQDNSMTTKLRGTSKNEFSDKDNRLLNQPIQNNHTINKYVMQNVNLLSADDENKPKNSLCFISEKSKNLEKEIKTEDQAWDFLLNDSNASQIKDTSKFVEDSKNKTKKQRKNKKPQVSSLAIKRDDSFVEIHAIDKKESFPDSIISISEFAADNAQTTRDLKFVHAETDSKLDANFNEKTDEKVIDSDEFCSINNYPEKVTDTFNYKYSFEKEPKQAPGCSKSNSYKPASENTSMIIKEPVSKKSKSLSPYPEFSLTSMEKLVDKTDIYVIDSSKDEFPEIVITRGSKNKKSQRKSQETELRQKAQEIETLVERPIKSWSTIAAKQYKREEGDTNKMTEHFEKSENHNESTVVTEAPESKMESSEMSLSDKLYELCKRTDIMVAECDTPSGLNFVEEHHAIIQDLPSLEPLHFGLDDFKLEIMKDSLLEVNSKTITNPICKINIDDILSSIKGSSSKVVESASFNIENFERVLMPKEKGFSVVEGPKITTQEVMANDNSGDKEEELTEKSSDEDLTPNLESTDSSEKEKNVDIPGPVMCSKQSAKSKKQRKKKK